MKKKIWITWETQRRSIELSKKIGCKLYVIEKEGIFRYPLSVFLTLWVFLKDRPDILFVQNPSIILSAMSCLYCQFANIYLIVDRHTTFRLNKPHSGSFKIWLFMRLHYYTLKNAHLTIVTNQFLADIVENVGGNSFVLPDSLPEIKKTGNLKLKGKKNLMLISSFGLDEPIDEVIQAMSEFDENEVVLYITGNFSKKDPTLPDRTPDNVIFTGFVSDEDFVNLLFSVNAVLALTTSEYCMLCGCYEAVAAEKPLITSNKSVLIDYFPEAVFVDNSAKNIRSGIVAILEKEIEVRKNTLQMKERILKSWELLFKDLEDYLEINVQS